MSAMNNEAALIEQIVQLKKQNTILEKNNTILMERIKNHDDQFSPYTTFEHSAHLAQQLSDKNQELKKTLTHLKRSNLALTEANTKAHVFKQRFIDR
ncbi:MAG: hybrid sensor histidine kinase/response regulator, partial [Colwellia sp.]